MQTLWQSAAKAAVAGKPKRAFGGLAEQWLVLITCRDEQQQIELLTRFQEEELLCQALLS